MPPYPVKLNVAAFLNARLTTGGFARSPPHSPMSPRWMSSGLVASGQAAFRTVDLMTLCELLDRLGARRGSDDA